MKIGIAYNLKSEVESSSPGSLPEDAAEEFDLPETIETIRNVLAREGHEVFLLGGNLEVAEKIRKHGIEFVFNLAEGRHGRNREAQIPALLELMGIPYSGSDPLGLAVTLDKSVMKRIAISVGVPTPEFWILNSKDDLGTVPDQFPLFVKPLWEGSSKGIRLSSRVKNRGELGQEIQRLFDNYPDEPVLVEEYIPGREVTVGILGNSRPEVIGLIEIAFQDSQKKDFCYSLEVKRNWKEEVEYFCPARLDRSVERGMREAAGKLFSALRLRDVARIDFRVNPEGKFYFLEINPLPGLNPESGDLVIMARKKGWSYGDLILKITQTAWSRYPHLDLEAIGFEARGVPGSVGARGTSKRATRH